MKIRFALLSLLCASILQAYPCLGRAEQAALRIEPAVSIRHSDNSADGFYRLGRYHQGENRLDEAMDAYRVALAEDGEHIGARNALAAVFAAQSRFDEALAEFHTILQRHPDLAYVHNNLGYANFLKNDYPAALAEIGTAIALDPANARAFGNLALVHEKLGDGAKARAALRRAAAAKPGGEAQLADAPPPQTSPALPSAAATPKQPDQAKNILESPDIEIANGTPNAGFASAMSEALTRDGVIVSRITDLKPYTQHRTVILYRDGFYKQAVELSRRFAVPPAIVNNTHTRKPSDQSGVRLVLGKTAATYILRPARLDSLAKAQ